ncbi:hypothetical protein Tco_0752803 [Tanacetum coccineum]|uniref:Uncharacterized protein n=1 Tax=Tanacetum coccineum TaxID=301880 RepID=A0ABQ4ZB98_9ASTR
MEVEPLDPTKLEDVGLDTCNHDIPVSSREAPSFDEPKPEPQPLTNCPSLDVSLGDKRGPKPPIKPYSLEGFRMKVVDNLTIHTSPSPHVAHSHPKGVYCYHHPCVDDTKKHYGFKLGLFGQSGSLGVNFSNLEMIEDDWQLESKEVSFLGEGLNLPVNPNKLENVRIKEIQHLEHIIQQPLFQHMAPSYHNGVFSTWMAFGGNTRDLGSFGEEMDEITDLHQIHEEILFLELGDGVAGINRRHRDPSRDGVKTWPT